ncbi:MULTISPECIES: metallophosphoesterase, partial [Vibrio]
MKTFSKKPLLYALAAFSIGVSFSSFAEIRNVTLLHTNDIESVYEPVDAFWNPDICRIGGIPYLATLIKQTRAQEETSFLFDAGDIFTGSLAKKTQGKLSFDLYSAMGYDAITLGNHEFE